MLSIIYLFEFWPEFLRKSGILLEIEETQYETILEHFYITKDYLPAESELTGRFMDKKRFFVDPSKA